MTNIQKVKWNSYQQLIQELRHTVFIQEQKVKLSEEFDNLDDKPDTHHFIAFDESEKAIGYARLLGSGKIGRMAVLREYRRQKIGTQIFREVSLFALKNQILNKEKKMYLHAQTQARTFYERAGFFAVGDTFMEAGIEHILMEFDPKSETAITAMFADSVQRFSGTDDIHFHLVQVTKCTSRYIDILSDHLQNPIFTEDTFIRALSKIARRSRNSLVRILLRDSKKLHGVSHPLVLLSQRLTSKIEIRALTEEPQKPDIAYLLSDAKRMVYFNNESEFIGFANYRAGPEAQNILEEFDNLWNRHSKPDPNLKRLNL